MVPPIGRDFLLLFCCYLKQILSSALSWDILKINDYFVGDIVSILLNRLGEQDGHRLGDEMNSWIYEESLAMLLIGIWLMLQCYHVVIREERKLHIFCVAGKLIATVGLLVLYPTPILAIVIFFSFYPKYEPEGIRYGILSLQTILSIGGILLCKGINESGQGQGISRMLLPVALILLFVVADVSIRTMQAKSKQLYHQMESTALNEQKVKNLNREISLRSQVAERNARLEERENIARNIHNVVGHTITSALVSLQAYEVLKEADPDRAEGKLSATSERMHLALEEIRRAVRVLDAETEDISLQDFCSLLATEADKFSTDTEIQIIHNFAEGHRKGMSMPDPAENHDEDALVHNLPVDCGKDAMVHNSAETHDKEMRVEKRTCEFLHSVLTECLNNGIRHGGATQFFVHLTYDTAHIRLVVSDNGKGFMGLSDAEKKNRMENGYGLRKMKDYVLTHAGTFKADGEDGFSVRVELPLVTMIEDKGES